MCLYVDKEKTEKFLKENQGKKFVYCYKILFDYQDFHKHTLESIYFSYRWKPGKHESDCKIHFDIDSGEIVTKSFHFFLRKEDAEEFNTFVHLNSNNVIVKFKCFMDSFVAAGFNEHRFQNLTNVAFTKVELEEEEYKCFIT